jgi:cytochrome c-type biogenesis protein CcsB
MACTPIYSHLLTAPALSPGVSPSQRALNPYVIIRRMLALLRLALGLYFLGLVHSVVTVIRRKETFFKPAAAAMIAGFICQAISITMKAVEIHSFPITRLSESFSFFAALAVIGFFIVYAKYRIPSLGVFAFPMIFLMSFMANMGYDQSDVIPSQLMSNWPYIHTPLVILGYVALFIAFSAAILYLIQERELKSKSPRMFYNRFPSLEICDDLAYKSLAIGFPLMTLGMISGVLWAHMANWSQWEFDAKILLSFVTWLIYLLLIHYRLIAGWRGKKAAYLAVAGFVGVLVTFIGASYFGGLHTFTQ